MFFFCKLHLKAFHLTLNAAEIQFIQIQVSFLREKDTGGCNIEALL